MIGKLHPEVKHILQSKTVFTSRRYIVNRNKIARYLLFIEATVPAIKRTPGGNYT
jgi:hypothetical protein